MLSSFVSLLPCSLILCAEVEEEEGAVVACKKDEMRFVFISIMELLPFSACEVCVCECARKVFMPGC